MKFEKFFKAAGTHGIIVKRVENENWLLCNGVGMKIPEGINNLGASEAPDALFRAILYSDTKSDVLDLKEALIQDPKGKAADIIRVFETELGERIGIFNGDYGLLETKDILTYLEVVDDTDEERPITLKYMVILDYAGEVIGFIRGTETI